MAFPLAARSSSSIYVVVLVRHVVCPARRGDRSVGRPVPVRAIVVLLRPLCCSWQAAVVECSNDFSTSHTHTRASSTISRSNEHVQENCFPLSLSLSYRPEPRSFELISGAFASCQRQPFQAIFPLELTAKLSANAVCVCVVDRGKMNNFIHIH